MATKQMVAVAGFLGFVGTFLALAATIAVIVVAKLIREGVSRAGLAPRRVGSSVGGGSRESLPWPG
jgi:hypothetical protein